MTRLLTGWLCLLLTNIENTVLNSLPPGSSSSRNDWLAMANRKLKLVLGLFSFFLFLCLSLFFFLERTTYFIIVVIVFTFCFFFNVDF